MRVVYFNFVSQPWRCESTVAGRPWWGRAFHQDPGRRKGEFSFTFSEPCSDGMMSLTFRVHVSYSISPYWKHPHRHSRHTPPNLLGGSQSSCVDYEINLARLPLFLTLPVRHFPAVDSLILATGYKFPAFSHAFGPRISVFILFGKSLQQS